MGSSDTTLDHPHPRARTRWAAAAGAVAGLILSLLGAIDVAPGAAAAPAPLGSASAVDAAGRAGDTGRIAAGGTHSCALNSGSVICWGDNDFGQLGYGHTSDIGNSGAPAPAGFVDLGKSAVSISVGRFHSCALLVGGDVRCWGRGSLGQLGSGGTANIGDNETPASLPVVRLGEGRRAIALAAGDLHTCAIITGGEVLCWGSNAFGQLGYGHTENVGDDEFLGLTRAVTLPRRAIAITAGGAHTCALLDNGTAYCWGMGTDARLGYPSVQNFGDDEPVSARGPVPILNSSDPRAVTDISAGQAHTCAVISDGTLRCWGSGADGRLGYGDTASGVRPAAVDLGPGRQAVSVSAGGSHTCARLDTGVIRCWGKASEGQLGTGSTAAIGDNESPSTGSVALGAGRQALEVSSGGLHTCALLDIGEVMCWGSGVNGRLGYGNQATIGDNEQPYVVGTVDLGFTRGVRAIAVGSVHSCALLTDGQVRCWGDGSDGRLGYGNDRTIGDNEHPFLAGSVDLGANREAVAVTAGGRHTCALLDNGTVKCWGWGGRGQLGRASTSSVGDDETPSNLSPIDIGVDRRAVAVTAGEAHTCALLDDGDVMCWGAGGSGRLGYGDQGDVGDDEVPRAVGTLALGQPAKGIAAGDRHTCALLGSGEVKCWGYGADGSLGYGSPSNALAAAEVPTVALGGERATDLVVGGRTTCVVISLSTTSSRCWGNGEDGQLGYGNTETIGDDETPAEAGHQLLGHDVRAFGPGGRHTCDIDLAGGVRCWGAGDSGQLGYADTATIGDDEAPFAGGTVAIGGGATLLVEAGLRHTCALRANASVLCWGDGSSGQLGRPGFANVGDDETPGSVGPVHLLTTSADDPPNAADDAFTVMQGIERAELDVLANDLDSDGGPLAVQDVTQPAHGTVVNGGQSLRYEPDPGYCNDPGGDLDRFTYTVNGGAFASVELTVVCTAPPPTAVDDAVTVAQDSDGNLVDVLANDLHEGGPIAVVETTQPAHGHVEVSAGGDGVVYMPDAGYCNDPSDQPDTFDYTVNGGSSATVSVRVTCTLPADTTAPDTTITTPARLILWDLWLQPVGSYSFTSSEPGSTFECSLDGAPFTACTSPTTLEVTRGAHTFEVRARDAAGNVDPTPATRRFNYLRIL